MLRFPKTLEELRASKLYTYYVEQYIGSLFDAYTIPGFFIDNLPTKERALFSSKDDGCTSFFAVQKSKLDGTGVLYSRLLEPVPSVLHNIFRVLNTPLEIVAHGSFPTKKTYGNRRIRIGINLDCYPDSPDFILENDIVVLNKSLSGMYDCSAETKVTPVCVANVLVIVDLSLIHI